MIKYAVLAGILIANFAPNNALALVGEPAPPLAVQEWVKGGPVEIKNGTNIYVVELWDTSFPSARPSIAVFNAIQERFKTNGVIVAGICNQPVSDLKKFVQNEGTNIAFAVGADDDQKTCLTYMNLIDQRGLPYMFVVSTNGLILWHGASPRALSEVLEQAVAGQFDLEHAKEVEIAAHQMQQYLKLVSEGDSRAKMAGRLVFQNRTNNVDMLCDLAMQIIAAKTPRRDFALANMALNQAEKLPTTNTDRVMFSRAVYLFETGHADEAFGRATQALALARSPKDKAVIESGLRTMHARLDAVNAQRAKNGQPPLGHPTGTGSSTNMMMNQNGASPLPRVGPGGAPIADPSTKQPEAGAGGKE